MSSLHDTFFRVGHLSGMGAGDLNGNHAYPQMEPGTIAWMRDAFGYKVLKYVKNVHASAALAKGSLQAYCSDGANVLTTTVSNITSGSTTHAITSGLTAGRHAGMICFVLDSAQGTGVAPEGEASIVANNTATRINLEPAYALSVALAANDDLELIGTYQAEAAADGDEAWTIQGVVAGKDGISAGNYGWVVMDGYCVANHGTNAISEGDPVVAGAAIVDAFGTDGQELWVGIAAVSTSTDEVVPSTVVKMRLLCHAGPGGSP
jgi:hypothetical protein